MKKYLITAALAVAISGAFVSCSDDIASDSLIEQKAKTFEKVFVEAYGTPAPNHTWGFKKNVTRGVNGWKSMSITRGEYADANLWYQTYKVPANVTAKEKKLVTDYFTDHLFVNKYRIEEAMALLVDKRYCKLNMEEISNMVGFHNRQSFYSAFYRFNGITPREYRLKHMTPTQQEKKPKKA